jgi:hypothetical protein
MPSGPLDGLSGRPSAPSLPLSRLRAEIRQWERQPNLLIDNGAGFELTGVERLAAPADEARHASTAAGPGELHLPAALRIPAAPRVRLPDGERTEVTAARRLVVDWLVEMRKIAADVHADGASPDDEADAFRKLDVLAMPAIVAALNAEKPGLNLVYAHCLAEEDRYATHRQGFGSVEWADFVQDMRPGRFRVLMDNDAHGIALDVAVVDVPGRARPRASVLLLNPLRSPETTGAAVVAEIADQLRLPPDWPLLVAEVPAQKSQRSCKIFALSMALKCNGGAFDALHSARLGGMALPLQMRDINAALAREDEIDSDDDTYSAGHGAFDFDSDADSDADSEADSEAPLARGRAQARPAPAQSGPSGPVVLGQEALDASQLVGPEFMKHAQSRNDVQSYQARRPGAAALPVNSRQQTLLERHEAHRVARWPAPPPPGFPPNDGTLQIYSASIELKRISFLDKAIRHAAACEPAQVMDLAASMRTVDTRWKDRFM